MQGLLQLLFDCAVALSDRIIWKSTPRTKGFIYLLKYKINLYPCFEYHRLSFDEEKLSPLMGDKQGGYIVERSQLRESRMFKADGRIRQWYKKAFYYEYLYY
ncbi:MAG: hypothetical protein RMZ41_031560 [Nostoc sp. DedVER02]|uniref:hypothetical protein n=1 Tax=unclassified Nostoc TaxID=2593658 RepID=UPI002AD4B38E|nr:MULTISPECIES: hypothetical protein [unclassified Nostoc]MDZ7988641.1 hypothetical protein [Nostoc sp. DedVER02]MDZ8114010.1 hypothetical protein [Nostoc sp. DedVER01b]